MARKQRLAYDEPFPKRLREQMDAVGIKPQQLAASLGITRQAVSNYMNGVALPDIIMLPKIATALEVSADYLIGLSDIPTNNASTAAAASYTGLSGEAVDALAILSAAGERGIPEMISLMLEDIEAQRGASIEQTAITDDSGKPLYDVNEYFHEELRENVLSKICEYVKGSYMTISLNVVYASYPDFGGIERQLSTADLRALMKAHLEREIIRGLEQLAARYSEAHKEPLPF